MSSQENELLEHSIA